MTNHRLIRHRLKLKVSSHFLRTVLYIETTTVADLVQIQSKLIKFNPTQVNKKCRIIPIFTSLCISACLPWSLSGHLDWWFHAQSMLLMAQSLCHTPIEKLKLCLITPQHEIIVTCGVISSILIRIKVTIVVYPAAGTTFNALFKTYPDSITSKS